MCIYAKGQFCCRFDSRLKFRGLKEMEHKNWVTKDENIWKPQIRWIWEFYRNANCQIVRFHNTENKATTLDDSKSWTTIQKLGTSKLSPYTRCFQSFQRARSTKCDFQFGEHAEFWGFWEQADPDEDLQCQLYLHLWPHMVSMTSHGFWLNDIYSNWNYDLTWWPFFHSSWTWCCLGIHWTAKSATWISHCYDRKIRLRYNPICPKTSTVKDMYMSIQSTVGKKEKKITLHHFRHSHTYLN